MDQYNTILCECQYLLFYLINIHCQGWTFQPCHIIACCKLWLATQIITNSKFVGAVLICLKCAMDLFVCVEFARGIVTDTFKQGILGDYLLDLPSDRCSETGKLRRS